jgi:hypothetical protein
MTDAELRAIVRDAVSRHLGRPVATPAAPVVSSPPLGPPAGHPAHPAGPWQQHASHHLYLSLINVDGSCVIEPSVPCDHCGYCKSHGH